MCIIAGSNRPQEGMEPHSIVGGGDGPQDSPIVWLWSHQSMDEAGDGAAHFSYVCEDCIAQKNHLRVHVRITCIHCVVFVDCLILFIKADLSN